MLQRWGKKRAQTLLEMARDSVGQTRIAKGGRPGLRHLAYMAALRVIVHCPEFKARYLHWLHDAGHRPRKPQVIVAVAAQLLRVLFAMAQHGQHYDPRRVGGGQMVARATAQTDEQLIESPVALGRDADVAHGGHLWWTPVVSQATPPFRQQAE